MEKNAIYLTFDKGTYVSTMRFENLQLAMKILSITSE